ncbi:MAG: radical SAM protein [Litorilinea sp.]|nr:MAG: radical SAM protein [Litorilinea sp.]
MESGHPRLSAVFAGQGHRFVYEQAPLLVYWEATQSCALACIHCRAEAVPRRNPLELTTAEAQGLLRQIAAFGGPRRPHLVITGGDPLRRPDLFPLIDYGHSLGLSISVTPAGTQELTPQVIRKLKAARVESVALSLDGSTAERHDAFRGVAGSFRWTLAGARAVVEAGIPLQINTMVTAQTLDDIPRIHELLQDLGITRWALFFLIATGRGAGLAEVTPAEGERLLVWLSQLARDPQTKFVIKTTEAHHYRRIVVQQMARRLPPEAILASPAGRAFGIRDGNGIVFVSHVGQVFPSGFLPLAAGNVRRHPLASIYRESPLFQALRDADRLKGKCGICPFRALCGGSRARAYAATGDPLESDPLCPYQPRAGDVPLA